MYYLRKGALIFISICWAQLILWPKWVIDLRELKLTTFWIHYYLLIKRLLFCFFHFYFWICIKFQVLNFITFIVLAPLAILIWLIFDKFREYFFRIRMISFAYSHIKLLAKNDIDRCEIQTFRPPNKIWTRFKFIANTRLIWNIKWQSDR